MQITPHVTTTNLMTSNRLSKLLVILVFSFAGLAQAQHDIHFSITEQLEVANDQMIIQLAAQAQAGNTQAVSRQINQAMQQAFQQLTADERNFVQTGQYSVNPRHNRDGDIIHWQGQQQLILTLPIDADISELLSRLQPYLSYQSMQAGLSHPKRQEAENTLLETALKSYQARAKLIAASLAANQYRIRETHINTQQQAGIFPQARMALAASMDSAPVIEAGNQTLSISVNGTLVIE
ncbi:SIMPL domain-containing protein [Thiomicrospira sp. ALE5]|uniref:SIMPL domain-containing protein n=1 Tax=Thiomicrospira sp. ALE5 TaxID=748650 RepID=UPI0008E7591A|nr:SIMPL domain-containing protein [Thiomicrospira sp. ALE5]SFR62618.1 Predicted secreted protein [Thiomicrospira sp. ALE5]